MDRSYSTEVIRQVWDDKEGVCIEIGPDRDSLGLVEIRVDGKSENYFGPIRLALTAEMARQVSIALLAAAKEAERET